MAQRATEKTLWPGPVDLGSLTPEERVNTAIEMSSVMGEIVLDSIRDRLPRISERQLLNIAHRRINAGRRLR